MIDKRFSLQQAYGFGVRAVLDNFTFFIVALGLGTLSALAVLIVLAAFDYTLFADHFEMMTNFFSHSIQEPFGPVHVAHNTVAAHVKDLAPTVINSHLAHRGAISYDLSRYHIEDILKVIIPTVLVFKIFLETMAVGWTKLVLDIQANKKVAYDYLYKFYYLVPRVLVVNIIVGCLTVLGLVFFILPGVFIYQRLRFARYYVIDKDQSIMTSLQSSMSLTDGSVIQLTSYTTFAAFLAGLGNVIFVTRFFLLPLSYQVEANVYRQMQK